MIKPQRSRTSKREGSRRERPKREGSRRERPKKISEAELKKNRLDAWNPKTEIGRKVKSKELKNIDVLLNSGRKIIESEVTESLLDLSSELLLVGQSKGKFGGGQRRVFRPTQKKTKEGNKIKFSTICIVGDHDGHIGIGFGKAKETVPAREKATREAKLNVFKIRRGCGSWECNCGEPHTVPFAVEGKCGSVIIKLIPAPKGKGLCVESEIAKILDYAGIKDCWSKTRGQTKNRINLIFAAEQALRKLTTTKVREIDSKNTFIVDESIKKEKKKIIEEPIKTKKVKKDEEDILEEDIIRVESVLPLEQEDEKPKKSSKIGMKAKSSKSKSKSKK